MKKTLAPKESEEKEAETPVDKETTVEKVKEPETDETPIVTKESVPEVKKEPLEETEAVEKDESVATATPDEEKKVEVETQEVDAPEPKEDEKKEEAESEEDEEKEVKPIFAEKKESFFYKDVPNVKSDAPLKIDEEQGMGNEDEPEIEKSNKKLFMLGFLVFIITVAVTFTAGLFILNSSSTEKKNIAEEKTTTPTPSPTPAASVTRSEWSFEVLNGSSTPGLAAKGAEKVKALGYEVAKVGNSNDTVDATQILVSSDATDGEKDFILEDLKKDFGDLSIADTLSDSKKTVRIILAK